MPGTLAGDLSQSDAEAAFGARLPLAMGFAGWLAGPGSERGLIGPREVDRLWKRHLLNCAALSAVVPTGALVVDIGSGAGLPGIVLAIARPDVHVICIESMLRRTAFLAEVVADLELANVEIRRCRAEDAGRSRAGGGPRIRADVVTARAVGPLERLVGWSAPLQAATGELLALKGAAAVDELGAAWPLLRRSGYHGRVDLLEIDLNPDRSGSFDVTTAASWLITAVAPAPAEPPVLGASAAAAGPPLATVLRISRTPE